MLDSETASFKGYKPVIPPEKRPVPPDRDAQIAALIQQKLERQAAQKLADEQAAAATAEIPPAEPVENEDDEEPVDPTPTATSTTPQSTSTPPTTDPNLSTTTPSTVDTTAPVVTLNGDTTINLSVGESYAELGATATDDTDGPLSNLVITGSVDTNTAGSYEIVYTATDAAGNRGTKTRTVEVTEPAPPAAEPAAETESSPETPTEPA
jgi:hypothetical protein